ncbi:OmpL47-type beta-barrel domain-containing protein [Amycolatopsis suaedae]|uniref:Copper-binding protein n=1 Tax=Amycolatopsis suaedae TaxID=2510978 RepID=A0A4Q7J7Y3_9PSEU|nr:Ig-like domain repeat protein [Amycolatopsis suaedae]RZQ62473.1 copper-binding protein [Amycolatopsis suaedae]
MSRRLLAALAAALTMLGLVAIPASATPAASPRPSVQQEPVLEWTADDSLVRYKSAPTSTAAGTYTISFKNSLATGNTTDMVHTLTFDTSTPGYNHDVRLNIQASPSDSKKGEWTVPGIKLTPGKYKYFCAIPGHSQMTGELVVTEGSDPDTTPPTVSTEITGNKDPQGRFIGSATVKVNATDTQSGVGKVEYKLDDGAWTAYTEPVVVSAVGAHKVLYRATDKANNVSPEGTSEFTVVEDTGGDKTPPTVTSEVTGNKDPQGNYLDVAKVTVTATDTESGVDKVEYKLDDGAWTPYSTPVEVTTAGMHMLHYRATDKAGNTSPEGMAHFTVVRSDTTPPTVSASVGGVQDPDGNYKGRATVTVAATDEGSGIAKTEYALDGGAWTAYTTPVAVTAVGAHTMKFRATDKAGNASQEGSVSFTVVEADDTTPPSVLTLITGPQDANWAYVGKATITVSATDDKSGVDKVEYKLDSGAWTAYSAPVEVTAVGKHAIAYRASDKAGNVSQELTGSFTVVADGPPPAPDVCPDSDTRLTVVIGTVDSQVPNIDIGNGCTINDVIDEDGQYASHNQFVRHVKAVTRELVRDGVIPSAHRDRIVTAAIESNVGVPMSTRAAV